MGKQVKTPRFYVDMPTFLHATGQLGWDGSRGGAELLYMNCANPVTFTSTDTESPTTMFKIGEVNDNPVKTSFPINFCALLNHNLAADNLPFAVIGKKGFSGTDDTNPRLHGSLGTVSNVLNTANANVDGLNPEHNGTSIWTFSDKNGVDEYWRSFELYFNTGFNDYTHQLGSMVVGKYWDAPNSPDLSLTMSRRFDGIKKQKTIGGKTLANIYYDGPTEWTMNHKDSNAVPSQVYKYPPFELDRIHAGTSESGFKKRAKSGLGRKGLRSWNLTFSYISEDNMWMENEVSSVLISDSTSSGYDNPMLTDDSFNFVWNCTLGGTLPFIFQPDNTNNNVDQFSICTFRNDTLNVKQVAFNTYTLSVTIDEVA